MRIASTVNLSMAQPCRWIVYYLDGSTFSSKQGEPWHAPRRYVQIVMQTHPSKGREILTGYGNTYNYWCWHGCWVPHDQLGLEQYLDDMTIERHVRLCGYWTTDETFSRLYNLACDHPEFQNLDNCLATERPLRMPE